jgi:hypothetical protein
MKCSIVRSCVAQSSQAPAPANWITMSCERVSPKRSRRNSPWRFLSAAVHSRQRFSYSGQRGVGEGPSILRSVRNCPAAAPGRFFGYTDARFPSAPGNRRGPVLDSGRCTVKNDPVRPIACKVTGRSRSAGDAWRQTGRLAGLAVQARIPEFDSHDPSRSFRHHTIAVQ